jgi:hypothetical protein
MAQCITCGTELHPDRAKRYDYCMAPECQEKNLKGLTMVAIGVNKAAEQYLILDDQTRDELASGKFADQRRGSFGTSVPSASPSSASPSSASPSSASPSSANPSSANPSSANPSSANPSSANPSSASPSAAATVRPGRSQPARRRPAPPRPSAPRASGPWTKSQERLALLYNEQGLRPEEIAGKLGLSTYTVTQIILGSRNRGKL